MRKRHSSLILLVCLLFASQAFAGPKTKTVLITAFEPFDGRTENTSQTVALEIAKNSVHWLGKKVRVETCILPVTYNLAAEVAIRCYERMNPPPDFVLSLGEGGPSKVSIEMIIENMNSSTSTDSTGKPANKLKIAEAGPAQVFTTIPVFQLYKDKFTSTEIEHIRLSEDAGGFVCNNTAYILGRYFERLMVPYGFIHVPASVTFEKEELAFRAWLSSSIVSKVTKTTLDFYSEDTSKNLKLVKAYFEEFLKANQGL